MSWGSRFGGRLSQRPTTAKEELTEAETAYREELADLQQGTYRLLRQRIAFGTIILAFFGAMGIVHGDVTRAGLSWCVAMIVSGAFGASSYAVHEPRPRRYVLAAALVFAVVGLGGGIVFGSGADR